MRYTTTVNAEAVSLEVTGAAGETAVSFAGCPISVDLSPVTPPSLYSLIMDGRSFEVFVEEGEPGEYRIVIGGEQYAVAVASERDARPSRTAQRPLPHSGEVLVKAPMPGLVVAVTVSVGDTVRAGQGLVQLEAMKMENELLAPAGGTVRAVHASKGQTVNVGQLLITIGP
ncbi:MAG: biotin/lipoyl-containing protein [Chloroflexota bacterium]|nr:biotin/lipoyl-containing protein [Chloroflexota bacterium]